MSAYNTVIETAENADSIKKSKFISYIFPCESEEEFQAVYQKLKKEHNGANHLCSAFRVMENIVIERYNDDGEPSGTAGLPILDVLRGNELLQCGVIVVRYFGGTKLGTGGLSRAYSDGARGVLACVDIVSKEEAVVLTYSADYSLIGKLDHYIETAKIPVMDKSFTDKVTVQVALRENQVEQVKQEINDLSHGTIQLNDEQEMLGYFSETEFILS